MPVIHIKDAPPDWMDHPEEYVYVGRPSMFGNPYYLHHEKDRADVLAKYTEYLDRTIADPENIEFRLDLANLRGKTLICYCHPKACHADVLEQRAIEEFWGESPNSWKE